jgi:hypothetical protein
VLYTLVSVYPDLAILHIAQKGEVAGLDEGRRGPVSYGVEIVQVTNDDRSISSGLILRSI